MVGRRIKLLREERKMSQAELAAALSCSRMTINNYETEKRVPDMDFALSAASFFGVTVEYLSGRTEFRDSDDIEISVQRAEQLMDVVEKLPQGETQRLLFYFTKALEKALETGLEDAAIAVLAACAVQFRRLMLAFEVAQKASSLQIQDLVARNVPRATVRAIAKDKNIALIQSILKMTKELNAAAEQFGLEMQKKQDAELEKLLD